MHKSLFDGGLLGNARTPFIPQSEGAECGLACLAMVGASHGYDVDLPSLRRRFPISQKGVTLKQMTHVADAMGFDTRALRGEPEDLETATLPAILHWNLNHFVVLAKIARTPRGKSYVVHDPAIGERRLSATEISDHFTGIFLELSPSVAFLPQQERQRLRISQLWTRMSGLKGALVQVLLLSLLLQCAVLAAPVYLQLALDTALPSQDRDFLSSLVLGFGALAVLSASTTWIRSYLLLNLTNALAYQIVTNLFRHLVRLPLPWFEKRSVGDVISRFSSTQPVSEILTRDLTAAVIDGLMAITTLALMFAYSSLLGIVALAGVFIYSLIKFGTVAALRRRTAEKIALDARETGIMIETTRGMSAIKSFGQENNRQRLWQNQKIVAVNANIRLGRLKASIDAAAAGVIDLERVISIYLSVTLAIAGDLSVGMIFAFQAYKLSFTGAFTRLAQSATDYRLLETHLERMAEIALAEPEEESGPASKHQLEGSIELRDVRFAYAAGEPEILKGVNLKIHAGETVAIVGASGGGKTTLLKIMLGLFEPTSGEVLVDQRPLAQFGKRAFRGQVGSVAQDDALYAGSLADNISFFDPEIDIEWMEECARLAAIHNDIVQMPMRYETLVGDMGSALSGGQKQRLILARALYIRPKILFIDEGTAHLDVRTEEIVNESVRQLGMTRILIAHRPDTIGTADRVVALVDGRIVERCDNREPNSLGDHASNA